LSIAALAGLLMAVQGSMNSALGKTTGVLEATFVVHAIGAAFALILLLLGLRSASGGLDHWQQAPWWSYLGGLLGVGLTYGVARAIPEAGVAAATTAIIIGQVSTAAFIDHFGLFGLEPIGFDWWKTLGLVFLAAGGYCLLK
jgi:transporter family-2 protein